MLNEVLKQTGDYHLQLHLSVPSYFNLPKIPFISDFLEYGFRAQRLKENALPPLYGEILYHTTGNAKFTLNGYGNFNQEFKSNMRLFEAIGCGSLLISEAGNYPDGFEEGKHYISYKDRFDLVDKNP